MILAPTEQDTIRAQAVEEYPFESCGVILARGGERRLLRCRNAQNELHARDLEEIKRGGHIICKLRHRVITGDGIAAAVAAHV